MIILVQSQTDSYLTIVKSTFYIVCDLIKCQFDNSISDHIKWFQMYLPY
jgi:hypothetical protein